MKQFLMLLLFVSAAFIARPDTDKGEKKGKLIGRVVDMNSNSPIEYATVSVFNLEEKLVTGGVTDIKGNFVIEKIPLGRYTIKVAFIGFEPYVSSVITLNPKNHIVDVGAIKLSPATTNIDEVSVIADQASVEYKIDKKVVNVGQQFNSASGTAVDVLQNVPSIRVDIEGNVSMRGSTGFTVLIDGKPTLLESTDALEQIPASNIENIELITNPSAKYDPEGTAGIINVITKKKRMQGVSGIFNAKVGLDEKYGGDFLLNFRKEKVNFFIGAGIDHRQFPSYDKSDSHTIKPDTTHYLNLDGMNKGGMERKSVRAGLEYEISPSDNINFGVRYVTYNRYHDKDQEFTEWTEPVSVKNSYSSLDESFRKGTSFSVNSTYKHSFAKKGHELLAYADLSLRDGDEEAKTELWKQDQIVKGSKNTEFGPSKRFMLKIDYTLPLREDEKIEAGLQTSFGKSEDDTGFEVLDVATSQYVKQSDFDHLTEYKRNIHALYGIYAGTYGRFGVQAGLRGEYTQREIETDVADGKNEINRFDIFPTLHLSYDLGNDYQVMTSYSRRIQRPRGYFFEPFLVWTDAFNIRQGNSSLLPEYTDSYELGLLKKMKQNFISLEAFYRVTHDKISRIRNVYSENVFIHQVYNVGTDYSLGAELAFRFKLTKWWETDLSGSLFNYWIDGSINDKDISEESFNWDSRFNNTFSLTKSTKLQANLRYESPSANAQGETKGFYSFDLSLRQMFFKRKLSATLQFRDVFESAKREFTSSSDDFYYTRLHYHKAPIVMLTLTYNFNNFKQKRGGQRNGGEGGEEDL